VFLTVTSTVPAVCAGVKAVIVVLFTTDTLDAALPPMETVAFARKPVPLIVIEVPPTVEPDVGLTLLTTGAGFPPPPPFDFGKIVASFFSDPGAEFR
jgi:hypothetical protein